jgi:hypothetical protein
MHEKEWTMKLEPTRRGLVRRRLLQGGLAASAALAATTAATAVEAHVQKPEEWKYDLVQSLVSRPAKHKVVFSNANVEAPQLAQIRNWLNSLQFSYQTPSKDLLAVAALYGSANVINYNDVAWGKYRLGDKYSVIDPTTGNPATRNIFQPRSGTDDGSLPPDAPKSLWQEVNVEALQKRGVIFLA